MKNFIKLFRIVLAAVLMLASCNIEKGGTIEVTNETQYTSLVSIVEGINVIDTIKDGEGTSIQSGGNHRFTFSKDGTYTVIAISTVITIPPQSPFYKTVILLAGNTEKVTIK